MLKPSPGYVLLEPIKEEKKKSVILLPEDDKTESDRGKVIAVGPFIQYADKKVPHDIKKGDTVFYKKYSSNKIKDGDKEYIIVKLEDIFAVRA